MSKSLNFIAALVIVVLASTLLDVVGNKLPVGLASFRFFWGPLTLVILVVTRPNILVNGPMKFVLLYGFFFLVLFHYTLWQYLSEWNRDQFLNEFYPLVYMTAIWSYYYFKKDFTTLAKISIWAFMFVLITLVTTNIALSYDINIVRDAAHGEYTAYQEKIRKITGAAGYGYAQSFVLLIPLLVYHIKKRKKMVFSWHVLTAILILLIFTLARAQVFANFVAGVIITVLAFIGFQNRRKTYIAAISLGLLLVLIPSSFYTTVIIRVSNYFKPGTEMHTKLADAALLTEFQDIEATSGIGARADRYPNLLEALLARPLTGNASYNSPFDIGGGGHLWWMNKLAWWGIPGFLLFVFMLYKVYKNINSVFADQEVRYYYFLSVLSFVLLGLMKNISGSQPWVMLIVVIPGLFLLTTLKNNSTYHAKNNVKT